MFLKSSAIFSIFTFISRIFGFIRDLLIASYFGTSLFADAFNVAFKLPNFFRNIFAEGAFSAAFVPIFSGKLSVEGKEKSLKFASNILSILAISLIVLIVIFELLMPFVIMGLAPGFESNAYKFNLTTYLTRITTPYLFFVSLVTFYSCILNAFDRFAAMAASPIILNIIMIAGIYYFGDSTEDKVIITAWAVFIGGLVQLIFIVVPIIRRGLWTSFVMPKWNQDTKRFFTNITPAALGSGITQINLWVGTIIATGIPGAVSVIYYVDRIVQLPIALIGVSIGVVILPTLSKHFKLKNNEQAIHTQNRAIEISLLLSLPCVAAVLALAEPMIYVLFQRGEFTYSDTLKTAPALTTLAIGIPAYVMNKILIPAFFAVEDTRTPVKISLICVLINIIGNLILVQYISYIGITLMTAITAWINISLLYIFAHRKNIFKFDALIKIKAPRIILSSMFLYLFLIAAQGLLRDYIYIDRGVSLLVFIGMILGGSLVYFYSLYATNAYKLRDLKNLI